MFILSTNEVMFNYIIFVVSWQSVLITPTSIFVSIYKMLLLFFSEGQYFLYLSKEEKNIIS